jgi:hypothetical protein
MIGMRLTGGDAFDTFGPGGDQGGAIRSKGILQLHDMTIEDNQAGEGGGVYVAVAGGGSTERIVLEIDDESVIEGNTADFGGGVHVFFVSAASAHDTVEISDTVFTDNGVLGSGQGGGLFIANGGGTSNHKVNIRSTDFEDNKSLLGGAIATSPEMSVDVSILQDSLLTNNDSSGNGGAIFASLDDEAVFQIEDSTISGSDAAEGGAVFITAAREARLEVRYSTISNNSGGTGGGIHFDGSIDAALEILHSTISDNSNIGLGSNGGGIWATLSSASLTIEDSIVSGNTADAHGGGIYAVAQAQSSNRQQAITRCCDCPHSS